MVEKILKRSFYNQFNCSLFYLDQMILFFEIRFCLARNLIAPLTSDLRTNRKITKFDELF